jgi:hypothetical protein
MGKGNNEYEGLDPFSIDVQFGLFIKRMYGSRVKNMPASQLLQLQRAFFAAWGQLLALQREEMPDDEDQAVAKLQSMWEQVGRYFNNEIKGTKLTMERPFEEADIEDVRIIVKAKGKTWSLSPMEGQTERAQATRKMCLGICLNSHFIVTPSIEERKKKRNG